MIRSIVSLVVSLVVAMVVLAGVAHADNKDAARPHVELADRAYKLGKFEDALVEYTKAYELFPAPGLLFNIGQCHRNLKNFERAVFFYEGYLRDAPPTADNRPVVEDLIREAKVEQAKQSAEELAQRRATEETREKAAIEAARVQAQAEADARKRAEEDRRVAEARRQAELDRQAKASDDKLYTKWWFWSAVAGGAALAIGGTIYFASDTVAVPPGGSLGGLDRR